MFDWLRRREPFPRLRVERLDLKPGDFVAFVTDETLSPTKVEAIKRAWALLDTGARAVILDRGIKLKIVTNADGRPSMRCAELDPE